MTTDENFDQPVDRSPSAESSLEDRVPEPATPDDNALLVSERVVDADGLFDTAFYARQAGISGSRAELIGHYLTTGELALLSPSPDFDSRFYCHAYPDVVRSGVSPLLHYILHGRAERRYATQAQFRRDGSRLEVSGLFDAAVFAWNRGRPARPGLSTAEDYLVGRDHGAATGEGFDSEFYRSAYDDAASHAAPILHYIDIGRAELRVPNPHELQNRIDAGRNRFNQRHYLGQVRERFPGQPLPADPLRHYILTGCRLGLDPAPDFSADYYLRLYPNMRTSGLDPFFHYSAHGHAEGRSGRPNFSSAITRGEVAFDLGKPTILVASHEASRTGAPLVGLNVGARLAERYNVVSIVGRSGPLAADFAAHSLNNS